MKNETLIIGERIAEKLTLIGRFIIYLLTSTFIGVI